MIYTWSIHCHSIISCFVKIQTGLTFLVPAYTQVVLERRPSNECLFSVCPCSAGASSSIGSMQAMYGKQSVDHACNINNEMKDIGKEKATSLPDILLVDFNQCEVSLAGIIAYCSLILY